ncbi:MAG: hypothetical protein R3C56_00390 [Pirellulaceae bacterium]
MDPNADANAPTQQPWTVRLDDDGRGLHLSGSADAMLAVQQSLDWQLSITTADGLETRLAERWSIEVTEDTPPRVIFQTADLAELASNAQLILRGSAADDLGLVAVRGRLQLAGDTATPAASLSIWQAVQSDDDRTPTAAIREFAIDAPWSIAQVGSFVAGQHLAVWLEACDNSGQWSQSQVQEFAIRDQRELIESIQEKQNQLLTQVRELVDTQRRNTQLFSRTWEMAHQAGELGREQIDLFRNTAELQRAVAERLGGSNGPQGLKQEIAKLSDLLTRNRLDETELAAELNVLAGDLRELSEGAMEEATTTTALTAVLAESTWKDDAAIAPNLTASAAQSQVAQSAALRGLEKLLDRLARNESLQQIERELAQILNQQNAIRRETNRLHLEGLADRSEESRAQLQLLQSALSADQQGLARRLDDWLSRAGDLLQSETADQQTAKSALARATQSLSSAQASGLMRRSTEEIRDAQLARAATTQQQVSELLSDTLRQLGAGNQSQLGGLRNRAEGLRQLSAELSDWATVQSALSERWQASPTASTREQLLSDQANAEQRTRRPIKRIRPGMGAYPPRSIVPARLKNKLRVRAGRMISSRPHVLRNKLPSNWSRPRNSSSSAPQVWSNKLLSNRCFSSPSLSSGSRRNRNRSPSNSINGPTSRPTSCHKRRANRIKPRCGKRPRGKKRCGRCCVRCARKRQPCPPSIGLSNKPNC